MENKYGFPQAFGFVDGTHIPTAQPSENARDYFSYKMKYTLNVQATANAFGHAVCTVSAIVRKVRGVLTFTTNTLDPSYIKLYRTRNE